MSEIVVQDIKDRMPEVIRVSEDDAALNMIVSAAKDPTVDIEKFTQLMTIKDRMEDKRAERAYNEAFAAAQAETSVAKIKKDAKNTQTNSMYARLEAINTAIMPIITKHGFSMSFGQADSPLQGHYRVTCDVRHRAGHKTHHYNDMPIDAAGIGGKVNKTSTHAFGSTMTYGQRYLTKMIWSVNGADDDDDGNAAGVQTITEEQCAKLRDLIDLVNADTALFCRFMKVEALPDLPAKQYERAVNELKRHGRENGVKVD
jgi:hypothetical protein